MPLEIVRNDITAMKVDVIVNSAHPTPEVGGGVDYAIHRAAGPELIAERRKIGTSQRERRSSRPLFSFRQSTSSIRWDQSGRTGKPGSVSNWRIVTRNPWNSL